MLRRRVDGILVVGLPLAQDELDGLHSRGYPVVCVGWGGAEEATVRLDDRAIGLVAVRHLAGLGHRVIGHVTGTPDDVHPWSRRWIAQPAGGPRCTRPGSPRTRASRERRVRGGRGATSIKTLLARRPDITAVFAASDEMAMGVILGFRDLGLAVPEDISVVGVDGHELGELVGLTTVAQPVEEQGRAAAELVLEMITHETPPRREVFPARLVERSSTAAPPQRG